MTDKTIMNVLAVLFIILIIFAFVCTTKAEAYSDFNDYMNSPYLNTEKTEEQLRLDWDYFFGCDIFAPYYKLELFKKSITSKCSFKYENFRTELITNNLIEKNYSIYYKLIWRFN
jgi:hypothetical protein